MSRVAIAMPDYLGYLAFHILASPLLAVRGIARARKRGYLGLIWKRLFGGSAPPRPGSWVVIVAGGLGEARVARQVARELKAEREADVAVLIQSRAALGNVETDIPHGAAPFNNPLSALAMLLRWRPRAIWVVEFWDNHHLRFLARAFGIPTVIFNVPITETEAERIRATPEWRRRMVTLHAVQADAHRRRLLDLGVPDEEIRVTGAIGLFPDPALREDVRDWRAILGIEPDAFPVIVAGSTYEDEERVLIGAFQMLREHYPQAVLLLSPRRLERHGGPESVLDELGLPYEKRSYGDGTLPQSRIVLLDSYGELNELYSIADVAFVGGTFVQHVGGHSPAEALAWAVPLTLGPHFDQQVSVMRPLIEGGCAFVCGNGEELSRRWLALAQSPEVRDAAAEVARNLLGSRAGKATGLYDLLGL